MSQSTASRGAPNKYAKTLHTVWLLDAWLWIALGLSLGCMALEGLFGVFSGFTLLIGWLPAWLLAMAMIFGGAALLMWLAPDFGAWARRSRTGKPHTWQVVSETATPKPEQWKVRTQPRTTVRQQRSTTARRVMEATI